MVRTPGSRHLKSGLKFETDATRATEIARAIAHRPPTSVPTTRPIRDATAEMRIEPANQSATPPMIEPRLKKLDAIAGMPKTFFAFNIPMTQRRERDEQNERKHDAREQDRELRFVRREPGRQHVNRRPARK